MAATDLSAIGAATTGVVTVTNAAAISGTQAEVTAALVTTASLVVAATAAVTVTDTLTVSQGNAIAAVAGVVTATVSDGDLATLVGLSTSSTDALTITVTDTTATAANLNTVDGHTSVAVNAAAVTTITGTAANVITAYLADAAHTITLANTEAVTLSGVSTYAQLTIIDGYTSGTITAADITDTYANIKSLATSAPLILTDATGTVTANGTFQAETIDMSNLGSLHSLTINGGAGADTILGSSSDDTIIGGIGADVLYGGLGNDIFYNASISANGQDSIYYFTTTADAAAVGQGADKMEFSTANLIGLTGFASYSGTGSTGTSITLNDGTNKVVLVTGTSAAADVAQATFTYNTSTGVLSFDADGTGTAASSIAVATLYSDAGSTAIADFASTNLVFIA